MTRYLLSVSVLIAPLLAASPTAAQGRAGAPIRLFDGRVQVAGDASITIGARDDDAFFNYTDYERNALRTLRLGATALWQPAPAIAVLAEIRTDDFDRVTASALYLRVRPFRSKPFDLQAGRIPPVFGAFGRQAYEANRLLIGYPLAYQYLTSLRADAAPADAGDLLRMRGRGWQSSFPIGSTEAAPGVPLISGFRWDTGVQARWRARTFDASLALTQGTLSNPRLTDDNGSLQVSGRVAALPVTGLIVGLSAARGGFLSDDVPRDDRAGGDQTSIGADAEYSAGRWLVRTEMVWTRWTIPFVAAPPEGTAVRARAAWVEGRFRVTPRIYIAARADALGFSHVTGPSPAERRDTWDAGVRRLEVGGGYSLLRNLVLRTAVQFNDRDGGRVLRRTYVSSQVAWWF